MHSTFVELLDSREPKVHAVVLRVAESLSPCVRIITAVADPADLPFALHV